MHAMTIKYNVDRLLALQQYVHTTKQMTIPACKWIYLCVYTAYI